MIGRTVLDEDGMQVSPSLAVRIGLNEAILLQALHFWTIVASERRYWESDSDGRDIIEDDDGTLWLSMTGEALAAWLPFCSLPTIRRTIWSLATDRTAEGQVVDTGDSPGAGPLLWRDQPSGTNRTTRYRVNTRHPVIEGAAL
jgi:hypothetical protein